MQSETRLTRRQAAIVGLFTGISAGPFEDIHALAEELLGRPVWTHQFADAALVDDLKERCKPLFLEIAAEREQPNGE